jgi:hypothetical protein
LTNITFIKENNNMYKYQNVSERTQVLTADGAISPRVVNAGDSVLSDVPIENANFKYLGEEESNAVNATVDQPQPTAVLGVDNQTNKENE